MPLTGTAKCPTSEEGGCGRGREESGDRRSFLSSLKHPSYPVSRTVILGESEKSNFYHFHFAKAVRRARRDGSTGSVRRVAYPFCRGFWKIFDGMVTGRFSAKLWPLTVMTGDGSVNGKHKFRAL
ncbi:hypothetical protein K438DRAFT_1765262 [Mycena galopus ATCC 62051]|nr:hypothetical protein K438DRAFT_1765262 [Mycena galopus ATCC 62051]